MYFWQMTVIIFLFSNIYTFNLFPFTVLNKTLGISLNNSGYR